MAASLPVSADIFTLSSDQIPPAWGWISRFLDRVETPDWTHDEVRTDLISGRAQLWGACGELGGPFIKSIWITRLESTPSRKFGLVWIAAGHDIAEGFRLFEQHTAPWFAEMGCEFVRIVGRKGWGKVLPGYTETARVFEREL